MIVATSNAGVAFAAINCGGAGGSGIAHSADAVAFTHSNGSVPPCVKVPFVVVPSH